MKRMEVTSVAEIWAIAANEDACRIGIDGKDGVGKTTLAKLLNESRQIPCISLDDYVDRKQGRFIDHLRYPELRSAIPKGAVIIEGVCLLQAVERLNISLDLVIYVKRLRNSLWRDENFCVVETDLGRRLTYVIWPFRRS